MIDKKDAKKSKNKYTEEKDLTCMCGKQISMKDLWSECKSCKPVEKKRKLGDSSDELKVHVCTDISHSKVIVRSSGAYENYVLCLHC